MGRHREFDIDAALDSAMGVFWAHGFEGTSVTDLVKATGVAASGLYKTFGNKEALFQRAAALYEDKYLGFLRDALAKPTVREVVEALLRNNVKFLSRRGQPPGCLGLNGAMACSAEAEPIRLALVDGRRKSEAALARRLKEAEPLELRGMTPEALSRYVMTISQGLAVQSKAGATAKQLAEIVDVALLVF